MGLLDGSKTKAIFAALAAAATAFQVASADGVFTGTEVGEMLGAFLLGLGLVFAVPFANYAKPIAATATAVLAALITGIENGGGIDGNEWYAIIGIIFAAIGTYSFPNATRSTVTN